MASIAIGEALAPAAQLTIRAFTATARAISDYVKANAGVAVGTAAALVGLTAIAAATTVLGVVAITASPTFEYWRPWPVLLRRRFWRWQPRLRAAAAGIGVLVLASRGVAAAISGTARVGRSNDRHDDGPWANGPSVGRDGDRRAKAFSASVLSGISGLIRYFRDLAVVSYSAALVVGKSAISLGRAFVALSAQIGRTLVVATAMFVLQTTQAAKALALATAQALAFSGALAGGVLTAGGLLIKNTAIAAGALAKVLAQGVLTSLFAVGKALLTLGTTAVSVAAFVATSFVSVIGPLAILGTVAAGLVVVFIQLRPVIESVFASLIAAGRELASNVFAKLQAAGAAAFAALSQGWQTLLRDGRQAVTGIGDALAAGDIQLAARALWAFLKLEFAKGYNAVAPVWDNLRTFIWPRPPIYGRRQFALFGGLFANDDCCRRVHDNFRRGVPIGDGRCLADLANVRRLVLVGDRLGHGLLVGIVGHQPIGHFAIGGPRQRCVYDHCQLCGRPMGRFNGRPREGLPVRSLYHG